MEENLIRDFLAKTGLKAKEIGDRLRLNDRTIQRWMKGNPIPDSMCKLIELEFTEYNFETGNKLEEPKSGYNGAAEIINKKTLEIERLQQRNTELEKINGLQARNMELLEEQIQLYKDRLKNFEGKTAS